MRMNEEQNMPDRSTIDGLHGAASYARPGHAHREPETRSTTTRRWRPSLDRHVPDVEGRATRSKRHRQDKRKEGVSMHRVWARRPSMIRTLCRGTALYDDRRRTNLHHVDTAWWSSVVREKFKDGSISLKIGVEI